MTPEDQITKVTQEMGALITELRTKHDEKLANEIKGLGVTELKSTVEKINDRLDKLDKTKEALEKSLTDLRRERLAGEYVNEDGEKVARPADHLEVKAAFRNFLRTGSTRENDNSMRNQKSEFRLDLLKDGTKSMSVISDPDGGYAVQADMNGRVRRKIFETSPVLSLCDTQTIGTDALTGVIDDNEASAGFVGELESRTETNTPQIGEWRIPVQEIYAMPKATQKLLDDASWDIERFLIDKGSEKMTRVLNTAFVSGIDPKQPRGFLTYAAGTNFRTQIEQVASGNANLLTADGLVALQEALKDDYRPNARWVFSRQTRRDIRTLKDSYGRYLMEPGLANGTPATLLGDEFTIFQDMPAVAASALPVVYADWKQFYQAVERQGVRILRDPYTAKGYVLFYMTRRMGGDVFNHEAGKIQVIAA